MFKGSSTGRHYDVDTHTFTTADGGKLVIGNNQPDLFILSYGSYGAPGIEYLTRRGYKQDGATVVDLTLTTRPISITFHRNPECTRKNYWIARAALIDLFRPNRGNNGAVTYTLREAGGTKRSLTIYPTPGFTFPPTAPTDAGWQIDEPVSFIAYDPVWFDPTQQSCTGTGVAANQLVFPITFPIVFSPDGTTYTCNITYTGNWVSYPTIVLTGPYTSAIVQNVTTGFSFGLVLPIGIGQTRTIVTTPGALSITDQAGADQWGDLSPNSDLVDFNIRPSPMVTGGINQIVVTLVGGTLGVSSGVIRYYNKYVGI